MSQVLAVFIIQELRRETGKGDNAMVSVFESEIGSLRRFPH